MSYKVEIPEFEGPLDLLLHLIKQENIDIKEIEIDKITKQYLDYINIMEELNLNIASEYLIMAAELIEIKSASLLPKTQIEDDEFEEDPKQSLINRLLEYEQYKKISDNFKELEEYRQKFFMKEPSNLAYLEVNDNSNSNEDLELLLQAFYKFIEQKKLDKPLKTKITNKEYSIEKRCVEIKHLLKNKSVLTFNELFNIRTKQYVVITFLAILSMTKNQEIELKQDENFKNIIIKEKDGKNEL